jgi:tRNA dimethylallyltransferase
MMRFVEVCIGTGRPYSSFLNQKQNERGFTPTIIGLEAERSVMYTRINQRVDIMMQHGFHNRSQGLVCQ